MMIDTSALLAVVFHEAEAARFAEAIEAAPRRLISAVNWLEAMMVAEARTGAAGMQTLQMTMADLHIEPLAFDSAQMVEAHTAWQRYGKGRHAAGLNLGDCCAYGAAAAQGEPLLFKGGDFSRTDIEAAPW